MNKIRIPGLVLFLFLAATSSARAMEFNLDLVDVNLHATDPGLVLWSSLIPGWNDPFSLDYVGDTESVDIFRLGTTEGALNTDDLVPYPIQVLLNVVPPGATQAIQGLTGAAWFFGSFGYVAWDNPILFAFGQTGLLSVSLSSATFGLPGSAQISATFELMRADTRTVPEPGTLALLGMGATFAAARVRRRRQAR